MSWRPRDYSKYPPPGGEDPDGQDTNYNISPSWNGMAHVVGGNWNGKEVTVSIMAQEVGHLFGLEPRGSPHFEDHLDTRHSKDPVHL